MKDRPPHRGLRRLLFTSHRLTNYEELSDYSYQTKNFKIRLVVEFFTISKCDRSNHFLNAQATSQRKFVLLSSYLNVVSLTHKHQTKNLSTKLFRNIFFSDSVFHTINPYLLVLFWKWILSFHCDWILQNADTFFLLWL